jgi:2-keto-3-deoxy-L-rhamnonate aldolase RhmA
MEWVKTNHVKRALRDGRPTGAWLQLCSISAEIMSRAGFDWLLIDMEHGHGDYQTPLAQLQAIEGSPVIPVAARAHGVALGNITRGWEQARELYKRGYQLLTLGSDTALVVQGAHELVTRFAKEVRET